jgi:methyl-accepting chemotaxis protein
MKSSIALKLTSLFAVLLLVTSVMGGYAAYSLRNIESLTHVIADLRVPAFIALGQMDAALGDIRIAQGAVLNNKTASPASLAEALKTATANLQEKSAAYEKLLFDQADKDFYAVLGEKLKASDALWTKVKALVDEGKQDEAVALFYGDSLKSYDEAGNALQDAVDDMAGDTKTGGEETNLLVTLAMNVTYGALALAIVLGIAAAKIANSSIARPIKRITTSMLGLAEGDTSSAIPFADRADEIGAMAGAVEVFRQAAISNKRLETEAEQNRLQSERDRIASQEKAEADAAERLRIATSGLATGLKRLAAGDLAFQLNEAFAPDFEALRHDFNQSVSQLGTAMSSIADSINNIDNGAREISSGANDLSRRTEQQAASLEETAAALDEITANVSNSTKRTEEARGVATQANQGATKSAEVVSHAEEAMGRIEGSSQQISNIIGVIDEIAFQTNLLALNAGVEAARAGDAGKGFAVVAQEVRELAQRSAQAAKEIKGLIQNSSKEVESGVKLVRDTGEALKSIGSYISQINSHMDAIATSAREQSTGLAEVNTAVNSMDQATQQNAAMVEQSTAASSSLAIEAAKLRELVGQFQLGASGAQQSSALRQTARAMAQPSSPPAARPAARPVPARSPAVSRGNTAVAQDNWEEF